MKLFSSSLLIVFFFFFFFFLSSSASMAEEQAKDVGASDNNAAAAVHIVYVEKPEGEEPEAFHIRTLAAVVGSEEKAREALVYSYSHAASGFSAKLTPKQVEEMSKQAGVLQVVPSRTMHLHSGQRTVGHFGLAG